MAEINVVLVRTIYPRNIGSVSRVMGNMGADRLILIDPKCEINLEARQGAAGAQKHLVERTTYKSWRAFYENENEGLRIAFCARNKSDEDLLPFSDRVKKIVKSKKTNKLPIYMIFGPEDHGLENDDLDLANYICHLPVFGSFKSLNLSHAVLLALYVLKSAGPSKTSTNDKKTGTYNFPQAALAEWLKTIGFTFGGRRTDVYKVIKRILLNNLASDKELRVLEAVIFQTIRKLKKN